jgi:hypothetical protein
MIARRFRHTPERGDFNQCTGLAHVGQPESPADQPAPGKDVLDFLGRGAGCDIEVLGRLAEQQVTDAAADDEALVTCFLQFTNNFTRMRAKLLEPDSVLGLGNGDEIFDDVLRCATG